jgi:small subunit ribosomal protein S6
VRTYELMVILDPSLEERTIEPSLNKYLTVVTKDGGTVDSLEVWGRRRLAYEIDKNHEGIYAVVQLTAAPDTVKELDRQLTLNESILRTKVIRPTVPTTASAPAAAPVEAAPAEAAAADEPADAPATEAAPAS